ncbi:MAG: DUF3316 domain-containing protein [Prevotella sp.]|nr:DUF3316 domain-containing protein [Prevotella sp.]
MKTCRTILLAVLLCHAMTSLAQTDTVPQRHTTQTANLFGVGGTYLLDTYLSPEKYSGVELRFTNQTTRRRDGSLWSTQLTTHGYIDYAESRGDDGTVMAGLASYSFARHYNWHLMDGQLHIQAGGLASANIGFTYNMRNQNNPAQLRLFAHVAPSAVATWQFHAGRRPMALRYEVEVPIVGVMFSPNFGQSYYEIFSRGNYDHNVVVTTPFNAPSLRHMLSLDVSWGRHTLRVGYMGDYQQSHVNDLKFHSYSHLLMVGYVKNFRISDIVRR